MSDVSVIGTGAMGRALVDALVASGADVTVWNRTRAKAEALSCPRVGVAESVAEALSVSPLTIVAVLDQELGRTLVEGAGVDLAGKVDPRAAPAPASCKQLLRVAAATAHRPGGSWLARENMVRTAPIPPHLGGSKLTRPFVGELHRATGGSTPTS